MALKNDITFPYTLVVSLILFSGISVIAFDWRIFIFILYLFTILGGFLAFITIGFMDLNIKSIWNKKSGG